MTSATSETPMQRLGRLVRARRKALNMTQADVQTAGGPSTATLRLIEGGKHADFRDGTGADLEAAIQWMPGSIERTLAGGDPEPLLPASEEPVGAAFERVAILQTRIASLQAQRAGREEGWSDPNAQDLDQLRDQLDSAQLEFEQAIHSQRQAADDARDAQLLELWMLARRLSNPEVLSKTQLIDASVALARSVAAYAESEVGGYSRMRDLHQANMKADAGSPQPGDLVGGGGATDQAQNLPGPGTPVGWTNPEMRGVLGDEDGEQRNQG